MRAKHHIGLSRVVHSTGDRVAALAVVISGLEALESGGQKTFRSDCVPKGNVFWNLLLLARIREPWFNAKTVSGSTL